MAWAIALLLFLFVAAESVHALTFRVLYSFTGMEALSGTPAAVGVQRRASLDPVSMAGTIGKTSVPGHGPLPQSWSFFAVSRLYLTVTVLTAGPAPDDAFHTQNVSVSPSLSSQPLNP